jgi:D-alanyl-D-alanine carboxypeptidase
MALVLLAFGVGTVVWRVHASSSSDTTKQSKSVKPADVKSVSTQNSTSTTPKTGVLKQFTGKEFGDLYNGYVYPNTDPIAEQPKITGDDAVDAYIRTKAEARGYRLRSIPVTQIAKVPDASTVDDDLLQPLALDGWNKIRDSARKDGINLTLISAYRSPEYQRNLFLQRLGATGIVISDLPTGKYDAELEHVLKTTSIPGYSRHHTGYTVDFGCGDGNLEAFVNTPCFAWISKNNYQKGKETGWIPSYPDGAGVQGPDPEPWEYVWVGTNVLMQ